MYIDFQQLYSKKKAPSSLHQNTIQVLSLSIQDLR